MKKKIIYNGLPATLIICSKKEWMKYAKMYCKLMTGKKLNKI